MNDAQKNDSCCIVLRTYCSLIREPGYSRRISQIIKPSNNISHEFQSICLVEYTGSYNENLIPHGNSNVKSNSLYVRTPKEVTSNIKSNIDKNSRVLYHQISSKASDVLDCPRDMKQIYNFRQSFNPHKGMNFADHIQQIMCDMYSGDFIQETFCPKSLPQSIVLYKEHQMETLVNSLKSGTTLVGIDRTFNIGPGEVGTYKRFFQHIKDSFSSIENFELSGSEIAFGSDEELALISALKNVFPDSTTILCTRHLKENLKRKSKSLEIPDYQVRTLENKLFNCLILEENEENFSSKSREIMNSAPKSIETYLGKFISNIRDYVWKPYKKGVSNYDWTNNITESVNHMLKSYIGWKPCNILELTTKFEELAFVQKSDFERVLVGSGNYVLPASLKGHILCPEKFNSLKPCHLKSALQKAIKSGFKQSIQDVESFVESKDKLLIVPVSKKLLKKPEQRSRIRTIRTRTI